MNSINRLKLLFFCLISATYMAGQAHAQDSKKTKNELKRYYRCFSHMVRERPSSNDVRVKQIKAGKLNSVDACMQVFDQAKLNESTWTVSTSADQDQVDSQAFAGTLHSITRNRCASCHGNSSSRPRHASSNVLEAFNVVRDRGLVNFDDIANSKIVMKVKNGHNCWSNCTDNALEIASAISNWKTMTDELRAEDLYSDGSGYNTLGKKVLKTFNDFHRSWFGSYNISTNQVCAAGTADVFDGGEMAYFVTRSMFSSEEFKNLVTSHDSLEGVRHSAYERSNRLLISRGTNRRLIYGTAQRDSNGALLPRESRYKLWDVPVVQLGELVGIGKKNSFESTGVWNHTGLVTEEFNLFKNRGAGVVSSNTYFLHNSGYASGHKTDGGMKVMRRWSRSIFNDLFCRDVPVVRNTDAMKYVDMEDKSELAFRKGISCMQCHSSMDQLARVARGVTINRSSPSCSGAEGHAVNYVHNFHGNFEEHSEAWETWVDSADPDFHKRPHFGKFYYRTTEGDLVDKKFEGFQELGEILANQDDLYRCAAKRYLKFFTGVEIPLFDKGDINSPDLTPQDKLYLKFINDLGAKLKSGQDLRTVVKEIIQSEAYLNPGGKVN